MVKPYRQTSKLGVTGENPLKSIFLSLRQFGVTEATVLVMALRQFGVTERTQQNQGFYAVVSYKYGYL